MFHATPTVAHYFSIKLVHIIHVNKLCLHFVVLSIHKRRFILVIIIINIEILKYYYCWFFKVSYLLSKKGTLIRSRCCSSDLSVKSLYLRNAWRYGFDIQTIYSDLWPHDFLKKGISRYYCLVYIAKTAYFDTIKWIKINRILLVDLELWNLAATTYHYQD